MIVNSRSRLWVGVLWQEASREISRGRSVVAIRGGATWRSDV